MTTTLRPWQRDLGVDHVGRPADAAPTPWRTWIGSVGLLGVVLAAIARWLGDGVYTVDEAAYLHQADLVDGGTWGRPYPVPADLGAELGAPLANSILGPGEWFAYASHPLVVELVRASSRLAGPLGPVLLSVAGVVAAAVGVERLTRWLGRAPTAAAPRAVPPMAAFWFVGLGSALTVHAWIVWAHAPAVGLAAVGLSLLLDPGRLGRAATPAAVAVLALVPMLRTEGVLFGLTAVVALAWFGWRTGRAPVSRPVLVLAAMVAGTLADGWWRAAVVGETSAAAESGLSVGIAQRVRIASEMLVEPGLAPEAAFRMIAVALVAAACWWVHRRPGDRLVLVLVALGGLAGLVGASAVDAYPSILVASPVLVIGAVLAGRPADDRHRLLVVLAAGSIVLPAVLAPTGAGTDWGGRYLLFSTIALTPIALAGVAALRSRHLGSAVLVGLATLTVVPQITALRVLDRSHDASTVVARQLTTTLPEVVGSSPLAVTFDPRIGRLAPEAAARTPLISVRRGVTEDALRERVARTDLDGLVVLQLLAEPAFDPGPDWVERERHSVDSLFAVHFERATP